MSFPLLAEEIVKLKLDAFIPGVPIPQGSLKHVGKGRLVDSQGTRLANWRSNIATVATKALKGHSVTCNYVHCLFILPQHLYYVHGENHYDGDKMLRAVMDALTGICWKDDCHPTQYRVDILPQGVAFKETGLYIIAGETMRTPRNA